MQSVDLYRTSNFYTRSVIGRRWAESLSADTRAARTAPRGQQVPSESYSREEQQSRTSARTHTHLAVGEGLKYVKRSAAKAHAHQMHTHKHDFTMFARAYRAGAQGCHPLLSRSPSPVFVKYSACGLSAGLSSHHLLWQCVRQKSHPQFRRPSHRSVVQSNAPSTPARSGRVDSSHSICRAGIVMQAALQLPVRSCMQQTEPSECQLPVAVAGS